MRLWTALALADIAICAVVGLALYLTSSPWCLLGLMFLLVGGTEPKKGKCPNCGKEVIFK
jgi:hypothetical protein